MLEIYKSSLMNQKDKSIDDIYGVQYFLPPNWLSDNDEDNNDDKNVSHGNQDSKLPPIKGVQHETKIPFLERMESINSLKWRKDEIKSKINTRSKSRISRTKLEKISSRKVKTAMDFYPNTEKKLFIKQKSEKIKWCGNTKSENCINNEPKLENSILPNKLMMEKIKHVSPAPRKEVCRYLPKLSIY